MDSYPDVQDYESSAKRIKLDISGSKFDEISDGNGFSRFSTSISSSIDITEATTTDCDSGYEASTMESRTPSHHTSPHTDSGDMHGSLCSLSESFFQTPTHTDQLEISQDSLEVDDDNASTVSHLSELSGLSDLSGQEWKPMAGSMIWIQHQMQKGMSPRLLLTELGVDLDQVPQYVDDLTLWKIIINMLAEPPRRNKLRHVNSLDDVVRLLKGAQNVIVLTGAGVSVSCGIPDFRSRDGIYSRLAIDFPNLPDPQAMFDINFFIQDPRPFFKFARDIYPGKFKPSPCHRFIKLLEEHRKLLRNYTQNIDTLEKEAGIDSVIECHGSFATATCTKCDHKVSADKIRDIVLEQKIPLCEVCHENKPNFVSTDDLGSSITDFKDLVMSGIMKPDIVFFGEGLPDTFHQAMANDKLDCDLLLVIGSSLKVRPVALIPSSLPAHVPQILINREPLPHCHFDVELLGDCDVIINHLCQLLGRNWERGVYNAQTLSEVPNLLPYKETHSFNFDKWRESEKPNAVGLKSDEYSTKGCHVSTSCSCNTSIIENPEEIVEGKCSKERHMSIDSARDSGIGDNSNFADLESESKEASTFQLELAINDSQCGGYKKEAACSSDMRGFWQPKVKQSLADRLPDNSFHLVPPSRYIFPGAEVYYDPDEKSSCRDDSSSSDSLDDSDCCEKD
ncbi:NAD-dependent protein deacetylase sirtuin-1 [Cylas formicarius]|uniref:NAD-dependent protein deacetylase sirtuin-1 n=1 Tax=Cylas formicarius TaxID=197179 RepID=UPI0029589108|nr:NAD-dependent protein deacetylase sirtuin-1 [Cylas formicarius]